MPYDYSKLRGRIVEKFGNGKNFSKEIGLSERSLSLKMNGKISWKQSEIVKACEILCIEQLDIPAYFFTLQVQ